MNILIIGCNRAGSLLARRFENNGHEVAIIDQDSARLHAFTESTDFHGLSYSGLPIDVDTLRSGGIENANAVFALTEDDTINIMVAQIAQEIYKIPHVWANITDPALKQAYGDCFSIWTSCPSELTADSLYNSFLSAGDGETLTFGNDLLRIKTVNVPKAFYGKTLAELLHSQQATALGLLRDSGEIVMANSHPMEQLQENDKVIIALRVVPLEGEQEN